MAGKKVQWGRVRQRYMAGKSYQELSEQHGVAELEKLMDANGKLIDALVDLSTRVAEQAESGKFFDLFDKAGSMKNTECLAKAIQTAVQTQRDLYKLPTLDQDFRKKAEAARKKEAKEKIALEREKLDMEKAKVIAGTTMDAEIWQLQEPEGEEMDG